MAWFNLFFLKYTPKIDKKKVNRIQTLLKEIARNPFDGIYQVREDGILTAKCDFIEIDSIKPS
jgi:glycosylphosphatidylinositol transamidase (GPIT) subunit GPI8